MALVNVCVSTATVSTAAPSLPPSTQSPQPRRTQTHAHAPRCHGATSRLVFLARPFTVIGEDPPSPRKSALHHPGSLCGVVMGPRHYVHPLCALFCLSLVSQTPSAPYHGPSTPPTRPPPLGLALLWLSSTKLLLPPFVSNEPSASLATRI